LERAVFLAGGGGGTTSPKDFTFPKTAA